VNLNEDKTYLPVFMNILIRRLERRIHVPLNINEKVTLLQQPRECIGRRRKNPRLHNNVQKRPRLALLVAKEEGREGGREGGVERGEGAGPVGEAHLRGGATAGRGGLEEGLIRGLSPGGEGGREGGVEGGDNVTDEVSVAAFEQEVQAEEEEGGFEEEEIEGKLTGGVRSRCGGGRKVLLLFLLQLLVFLLLL